MKHPRVAVLLPVYNRAWCLGDTIESLNRQTFRDFAVIAVDDASTDGSFDLLFAAAQAHPLRWKVFRNTENLGAVSNANRCLAIQRRDLPDVDYLIKVDAGTVMNDHLLGAAVAVLDHDQASIVCHFRTHIEYREAVWDTASSPLNEALAKHGFSRYVGHMMAPREALFMLIRYDNFISSSAALLRRRALEALAWPYYDERFRLADYELWTRLAVKGRIRYLAEPSLRVRRSPGMASTMLQTDPRVLQREAWLISVRAFLRSWKVVGIRRACQLLPVVAFKCLCIGRASLFPLRRVAANRTP